ncbi:hypothetical protein CYLTODRAFT_398237 [Cylindrobasidium torrendii FP15055 ss-10]|uniref:VWFA domain-containing protein n=1 Tax=Cylindrobasidium torrendii FP15055 ss-10 TaxID=1314674 RepID=A0A0D7B8I6_9AGAR|nr:hypothetical protein CYLTODRAFT_398237 [Cylindrobasidium torrendii FP15055 ss-10]
MRRFLERFARRSGERGVFDAVSSLGPPPGYFEGGNVDVDLHHFPVKGKAVSETESEEKHRLDTAFKTLQSRYDTTIVVDDSGIMEGRRWDQAKAALCDLAGRANEYDSDGIEVCFLNSLVVGRGIRTAAEAKALFSQVNRPRGGTPIGAKLDDILSEYVRTLCPQVTPLAQRPSKYLNVLIITDGEASDPKDVTKVIVRTSQQLEKLGCPLRQLGIQFVQVGDCSKATAYLDTLDNDLAKDGAVRDIVDTIPYRRTGGSISGDMLIKALTGGFNKTEDERQVVD